MFQGVYINLDKAVQRRQRMDEQLTLNGLTGKVERFAALTSEGFSTSTLTSGQVGCFRSHLSAIKMGSKNSLRLPMVIFEDDVVIPSLFEQSVNAVLTSMQKHPWDIIFLNQVMDLGQYFRIKALLKLKASMGNIHEPNHSAFQLLHGETTYSAGTAAYIVNSTSLDKMEDILTAETKVGINKPIDTTFRGLLQRRKLTGYVLFPFLCGLHVCNDSSIDLEFGMKDPTETFAKLTNVFASNQDLRHLPKNYHTRVSTDSALIADLYESNFARINGSEDAKQDRYKALSKRRQRYMLTNKSHFDATQEKRLRIDANGYTYKSFDETRSIFVHVPKCAGVSVCKALYGNLAGGHMTLGGYSTIFEPSSFLSYYKFTFVRNPYDRLVSAFHFLQQGGMNGIDRAFYEKELIFYNDFSDFVRNWVTAENIWKYLHFMPQYHFVRDLDGIAVMDYIGRFETLEKDFKIIANEIGCANDLPKINNACYERRANYYDGETKKIVGRVYARDFEEFGYSFDRML